MEDVRNSTWIVAALDQYENHLIRYAAWILGDMDRAREVVQETFLRLCKQRPARMGDHLAQWSFAVCRNLAFDVRKKDKRMSALSEGDMASASTAPVQKVERDEAMSHIFRLIETLPKNQREVLRLKFQCDLTYKEISEVTRLSVTNVGFLIHTAIKTLRREMLADAGQRRAQ